jgi:hypothetical protein
MIWSEDDIRLLRANWPFCPNELVAAMLRRSSKSAASKAARLRIMKCEGYVSKSRMRKEDAMRRRSVRRDRTEAPIVRALEAAGFMVWLMIKPCDLLVWRADKGWRVLECKTPDENGRVYERADQMDQRAFLALTQTPVVKTPEEALQALGAIA